jgi:POT family proton-dependent oligopeptide transporter
MMGTQQDFLGHPKGLYVCFATEFWERFSFYGMKYLLLLYLTKYHLFTDSMGLDVLASYAALVYAMPVLGGLLADRYLGMRKAVSFGGLMLVLGHLGMAYEGHQAYRVGGEVGARSAGIEYLLPLTVANRDRCWLFKTQYLHHCRQALRRQ